MPQRKNSKGDLGSTKIVSDSYDTNNIFLSDQGWVYRHWKGDPTVPGQGRYWDEIIVAGKVPDGLPDRPVEPLKYSDVRGGGSEKFEYDPESGYEPTPRLGDGRPDQNFDIDYSDHIYEGVTDHKSDIDPTHPRVPEFDQFPPISYGSGGGE